MLNQERPFTAVQGFDPRANRGTWEYRLQESSPTPPPHDNRCDPGQSVANPGHGMPPEATCSPIQTDGMSSDRPGRRRETHDRARPTATARNTPVVTGATQLQSRREIKLRSPQRERRRSCLSVGDARFAGDPPSQFSLGSQYSRCSRRTPAPASRIRPCFLPDFGQRSWFLLRIAAEPSGLRGDPGIGVDVEPGCGSDARVTQARVETLARADQAMGAARDFPRRKRAKSPR
jgi:hypothetical protein